MKQTRLYLTNYLEIFDSTIKETSFFKQKLLLINVFLCCFAHVSKITNVFLKFFLAQK